MSVQKSQGKRRAQAPRPDELPRPVAAPQAEASGPVQRRRDGRVASSEAARELGRRGGRARAQRAADWAPSVLRLRRLLPASIQPDAVFAEYVSEAERWGRAYAEDLSNERAGGKLGPGVLALVRMAIRTHAEWHFLADVLASGAWRFEHDEKRKPSTMPRTDVANEVAKLEAHFARLQGWIEELARDAAKSRPRVPAWPYALTAPTTTTSASASTTDDASTDSRSSGFAPLDATDHDDEPTPSADVRSGRADDEDEARTTRTATRPVEPAFDPAPWMPVPELKPHAEQWFGDMRKLAEEHPLGFRAGLFPRTTAMQRRGALTDDHVQAVVRWLAQPWTPPTPTL